jgi:hypothetical protein
MIRALVIGAREWFGRLMFAVAAFGGAVLLADCTDPGGPSLVTLGVDVEPLVARFGGIGGTGPMVSNPADLCVRLPVLLGSAVDKKTGVAPGLSVKVHATRESAEVTFPGADNEGTARTYGFGQLQVGVNDTVVLSVDGEAFEATIATDCTNP